MLFSQRSQEALKDALTKSSGSKDIEFSETELEEISLSLLSLCSSSLKLRMERRAIGSPLPGTGEFSPEAVARAKAQQMNLFGDNLDGQGGSVTRDSRC